MAIEKVREYFRKQGMEERIQEFDVSSATVELAAKAAGRNSRKNLQNPVFRGSGRRMRADSDSWRREGK